VWRSIVGLVEWGMPCKAAAEVVDVPYSMVRDWRKRGSTTMSIPLRQKNERQELLFIAFDRLSRRISAFASLMRREQVSAISGNISARIFRAPQRKIPGNIDRHATTDANSPVFVFRLMRQFIRGSI